MMTQSSSTFRSLGGRCSLFLILLLSMYQQQWSSTTSTSAIMMVHAFVMPQQQQQQQQQQNNCVGRYNYISQLAVETHQPNGSSSSSTDDNGNGDPEDVIARRIIVKGDVQGGYYRSCVLNEAGRFRRLMGTMSPPDDSDTAEIYVEGKRKMVDGFLRWCKKGNVGLSQVVTVAEVMDAEPTGLYDGFYARTN